jgi:NTE family protein
MAGAPTEAIPTEPDDRRPESAALCLSGGGYRTMVFHVGVLWRLYEARLLGGVKRISSVSGGSITFGLLGVKWRELGFDPATLKRDFVQTPRCAGIWTRRYRRAAFPYAVGM